ncbi:hypothetical protein RA27_22890 [Ruegeria sp. ANG-R]|uniref:type II toxin-antitoxin system CcdA family antitoxin n=1 Tax=Ruegeria sp. ANG-R TaxID=1577903 RepID=UPI00057EDF46|nr:type II toxin-antitoxin system CcdA family antitoxin [Ruegeria sp. ANG-R]KIC35401.1 hypothetical protein RA27_22890 [Ruegeria sp. ANG-R]
MAGELKCTYEDIEADVKSKMFCHRLRAKIAAVEVAEWNRENAQAVAESDEWVEQNGLPLTKYQPE